MKNEDENYIPRFSFEVPPELKERADRTLYVHGIRKAVMVPILNDLVTMIEEHGQMVIGVILDGGTRPRDVIPTMAKAERRAHGSDS